MRNLFLTAAVAIAVVVSLSSSIGRAGTFIPLPMYPGSVSTTVEDISNTNVVVGQYINSDGTTHGFVGPIDGSYTSFDAPAGSTNPGYISDDGYITGWGGPTGDHIFGDAFLRKPDGTIIPIMK